MKAILTSAGFDNDNLVGVFHELLGKQPNLVKALFIPTALNTPKAREYVHVFLEDLYKVGITDENIDTYDLNEPFDSEKITEYGIVFICPGNPEYLLKKINEMDFSQVLKVFFRNGGVYIGVSAGSDIAAANFPKGLGYIKCSIECHAKKGARCGILDPTIDTLVKINDNQAIVIKDDEIFLVE